MYLITGATGNVGSEIVGQLVAAGQRVRVLARDAAKVARWGSGIQVAIGDFQNAEVVSSAMTDVEALFLMNRGLDQAALSGLLASARAAGVARIVFLSTLVAREAQSQIGRMHLQMEEAIRATGLEVRCLRPGGFMSNAYQWSPSIRAEGVVQNALGQGKVALIAPEDIAAVGVRALTDSTLTGDVFELTGEQMLTVPEQAAILAQVLGKPIRCVDVDIDVAVQNMIGNGIPAPLATAVGESYRAIREGKATWMTDTVERVTRRKPMTFESWVRRHAGQWG